MDEQVKSLMDSLDGQVTLLTVALNTWAGRDDSKAQPQVREAANTAVSAIDTMLAKLHDARSALVSEVRASDTASDARIDAMLAMSLDERLAAREAAIRGEDAK